MKNLFRGLLPPLSILFAAVPLCSAQMFPSQFRDIKIEQKLGAVLPLETVFRDQTGAAVTLGSYFGSKPVLLVPVYYTCTTLCSQVLKGVVNGLGPLSLRAGHDFEVVVFSFNPAETPADARKEFNECTLNYSGRAGAAGWHFLTGSPASIRALTQSIGFHYRYDPATKMFVHATAVLAITPQGSIARYFFGVTYEPYDLQQGIVAAARGQTRPATNLIRLLCYPFTPASGEYGNLVISLLRVGALLTVLLMALSLFVLWRSDIARHRAHTARRDNPW